MLSYKNSKKLLKSNGLSESFALISVKTSYFKRDVKIKIGFPLDMKETLEHADDKRAVVQAYCDAKHEKFLALIENVASKFTIEHVIFPKNTTSEQKEKFNTRYNDMFFAFKSVLSEQEFITSFEDKLEEYVFNTIYYQLENVCKGITMSNDPFSKMVGHADNVEFSIERDGKDIVFNPELANFLEIESYEYFHRENGKDYMPYEIKLSVSGKTHSFGCGFLLIATDKYGNLYPRGNFIDFLNDDYDVTVMDDVTVRLKFVHALTEAFKEHTNLPDYNGDVINDYDAGMPYNLTSAFIGNNFEDHEQTFVKNFRFINITDCKKEEFIKLEFQYGIPEDNSEFWTGRFKPSFIGLSGTMANMKEEGVLRKGGLLSVCHIMFCDCVSVKLITSENQITGEKNLGFLVHPHAVMISSKIINTAVQTALMMLNIMQITGNYIDGPITMEEVINASEAFKKEMIELENNNIFDD